MTLKSIFACALAMSATVANASLPVTAKSESLTPYAAAVAKHLPGTSMLGPIRIDDVKIDDGARKITVTANENIAYIPLTAQSLAQLKNDIAGVAAKDYEVVILANSYDRDGQLTRSWTLDQLAVFADKTYAKRSGATQFVKDLGAQPAPKGLDGANIALWQSHGWYFEPKLNRWEWQRARIFQTVEDLYPQAYVIPYLMPMLRNAGAYVMSPRERDVNTVEIIADNDHTPYAKGTYTEQGQWSPAKGTGFAYKKNILKNGDNPFKDGTTRMAAATSDPKTAPRAQWSANFQTPGTYAVYISYAAAPENATDATYRVNSKSGARDFKVNQQIGGGTWIYLGHFDFDKGTPALPVVELIGTSSKPGSTVNADAVKIGGGMGNVARIVGKPIDDIEYDYVTSGYPRYTEAARYFMQWAGVPDSVYTPTENINDYTDDYRSRGEWVNWLAGGSEALPQRDGLGIPVDLSFAFHTDAGTTLNDSIIGTLGIYSTEGRVYGDNYADGTSRLASRDFTDLVMTNIVNDIRAVYEPNWTRRGMWDKTYFEARVPEVPAMLLELLSHQNFADMKLGMDPEFRFLVSRAIYKGMLQFLAHRDGRDYVVTPLAPRNFAINAGKKADTYDLVWQPTPDTLEATATAKYYIVEERINNGGFKPVARVTKPSWTVTVSDSDIHSYRIVAGNEGGVSFAGEVLTLCNMKGADNFNIVNGFTRVSAPDWFDSGEIAGFYDTRDGGVPDIADINYIGKMFEYRRDIPWMDDDAAGFGASRANFEDKVIAGNTHDFVFVHGQAIKDAGYGFVSSSVAAFADGTADNRGVKFVDLILGKQKEIKKGRGVHGTMFKAFPSALQDRIAALTAAGTGIFVSGAYVATDIWDNPNSNEETARADRKFATEVLGYHWRVGQASVTGEAYQVPTRFRQFTGGAYSFSNQYNSDCYAVESPDSFYPSDDKRGATFMRYTENNLIAGTAFNAGAYRAVVIGFPFETITGAKARASLMRQVIDFLDNRQMPADTHFDQQRVPQAEKAPRSVAAGLREARRNTRHTRPVGKGQKIEAKPDKQAQNSGMTK